MKTHPPARKTKRRSGGAASKARGPWVVYVLRCGDGTLYCGVTNRLEQRLAAHRAGRGARYTRGRGPLRLEAVWRKRGRSTALRAEAAFKALSREAKMERIRTASGLSGRVTSPG